MIAGDLIRQAHASGIELRLVGGKVRATGSRSALARLIEPLRKHREALTSALQAETQEILLVTPSADSIDWRVLDAAYLIHHFNCRTCIAAGRGSRYGQRCGTGIALWRAYSKWTVDT